MAGQSDLDLHTRLSNPIEMVLPLPPSSNAMYNLMGWVTKAKKATRGTKRCPYCQGPLTMNLRRFLSPKAEAYKLEVQAAVAERGLNLNLSTRIAMQADVSFATKRDKQDAPNRVKLLQDGLTDAGLYLDDSQVDETLIKRVGYQKGGQVLVKVWEI